MLCAPSSTSFWQRSLVVALVVWCCGSGTGQQWPGFAPIDNATSDIPSPHFTQENSQSDVRVNIVLRAAQPPATLFPGASPKRGGWAEWLLAVPIRMHRWANKNHMTSFVKSCWQAWRSKTDTWPSSVVRTLSTMATRPVSTAHAALQRNWKGSRKSRFQISTASLCQNLSCDLSQKTKCNDKMKANWTIHVQKSL